MFILSLSCNMSCNYRVNSGKLKQHIFKVRLTSKLFYKTSQGKDQRTRCGCKARFPVAEDNNFNICVSHEIRLSHRLRAFHFLVCHENLGIS